MLCRKELTYLDDEKLVVHAGQFQRLLRSYFDAGYTSAANALGFTPDEYRQFCEGFRIPEDQADAATLDNLKLLLLEKIKSAAFK